MIRFSQFLIEAKRELSKTDLKTAITYAKNKFADHGNDLYDIIPEFDKNYEFAQIHGIDGHTQRKDMPVIRKVDIDKFKNELNDQGISAKLKKVEVGSLRPIQKQIYFSKSISDIAEFGLKKTLEFLQNKDLYTVVSKDGYIIDGHHRFLTAMLINPKMKINALIIDMPITELLPVSLEFSDRIGNIRNESIETF